MLFHRDDLTLLLHVVEQDYFQHSEILSWRVAKYGKSIFNGLFQKESVFQKTSSISLKLVVSLSLDKKWAESIFWLWARIFDFCLIFIDIHS